MFAHVFDQRCAPGLPTGQGGAVTLDAVGAFDRAEVASVSRHRTTKRWLAHRAALSAASASQLTPLARTLRDHLPATREALAEASITPQHAAAIAVVVRTVGPEHAVTAEPILLGLARRADPAAVRQAPAEIVARVDPAGATRALYDASNTRGVSLSVAGNHGYLDGVFDVESTELLQSDLMPLMAPTGTDDTRSARQRRADALLDIVTKHLSSAPMPQVGGHRPHLSIVVQADQLPPATDGVLDTIERPVSDAGRPRGWRGVVSLPWTGVAVPAIVVRRWSCDASLSPVLARLLRRPRHVAARLAAKAWSRAATRRHGYPYGSAAHSAPRPRLSDGHSPSAMAAVSTLDAAARRRSATRTTSCMGPTADPAIWTTWSCSAGTTTARSMRGCGPSILTLGRRACSGPRTRTACALRRQAGTGHLP